jgi:PAS domain S-box-containing protein
MLFSHFPSWVNGFLVAVHLCFTAFLFSKFSQLLFCRLAASAFVMGALLAELILDVISLTLFLVNFEILPGILIAIAATILVICVVAMRLMIRVVERRVVAALAYNRQRNVHEASGEEPTAECNLSENDKQEQLASMGLKKRYKCVTALLCGVRNGCDLFIDFSLVKFAVTEFRDAEMLALCLRLMIFFPAEYRHSNLLCRDLRKQRDLHFSARFLIHQIEKIRVIRQSSSSSMASEKLKLMRTAIADCEEYTKGLALQKRLYYPSFGVLYRTLVAVNARCQEIVSDFPHSTSHAEAYIEFLVESATDFSQAISLQNRLDQLRAGKSRAIDYCFKAMVRVFPLYLKRKILDTKGAFRYRRGKMGSAMSQMSSGHGDTAGGSDSLDLDAAREASLGNQLLNESKTRLAAQGALKDKTAYSMRYFVIYTVFQVVASLIVAGYGFFGFSGYFANRVDLMERGRLVTGVRSNLGAGVLTLLLFWGEETGNLDMGEIDAFYTVESHEADYIDLDSFLPLQTSQFLRKAQDSFNGLQHAITNLAVDGNENVYSMFPRIFKEIVGIAQCSAGAPLNATTMNLQSIFAFIYVESQLATLTPASNWYQSDTFCEIMTSFSNLTDALAGLRESDRRTTTAVSLTDHDFFRMIEIVVPIIYAVAIVIPLPIVLWLIHRELCRLCELVEGIAPEQRRASMLPIMKPGDEHRKPQGDVQQLTFDMRLAVLIAIIVVFYVVMIALTALLARSGSDSVDEFENGNVWSYALGIIKASTMEIVDHTFQWIYLTGGIVTTITTAENERAQIHSLGAMGDSATSTLLDGDDLAPSMLGVDQVVDDVFLLESCQSNEMGDPDFHDSYRCSNLAHLLVLFSGMAHTILERPDGFDGVIDAAIPLNMYHMMTNHILPKMEILEDFLATHITNINDRYEQGSVTIFAVEIALAVVAALIMVLYKAQIDQIYSGILTHLRRCSPAAIVAHVHLLDYLLDVPESEPLEMTPTQNIIHTASDGIICVSRSGTIESTSSAVTAILGFIPEQLLGQHIVILFAQADATIVQKRLDMMIRKECPRNFTDTVQCLNEADTVVNCDLTVMGMDDADGELGSFVIILRDITTLLAQQQAAELAKQQSEKLLYEILPRDIVNRLNQHEKDITFVVQSATLMFIDIQKFSAYAATLTPQDIMGTLSLIFGSFDSLLVKYPLITKIKLIGDVYMSGSGLFNTQMEPETHAEQTVRFGLDALRTIEECNVKLSANLAVRIGVNTGGPIIAGVLGTDKPVFDIIGDPINIAARLQSTCPPGRIQISEDTFGLVRGHGFVIEPRGDVFLKGKGNRPAFLVAPAAVFQAQLSSADSRLFGSASLAFSGQVPPL